MPESRPTPSEDWSTHLLAFLVAGVQRVFPLASVVSLRKDNAAKGAPGQILDQLAAQTDFVVSAMAD